MRYVHLKQCIPFYAHACPCTYCNPTLGTSTNSGLNYTLCSLEQVCSDGRAKKRRV